MPRSSLEIGQRQPLNHRPDLTKTNRNSHPIETTNRTHPYLAHHIVLTASANRRATRAQLLRLKSPPRPLWRGHLSSARHLLPSPGARQRLLPLISPAGAPWTRYRKRHRKESLYRLRSFERRPAARTNMDTYASWTAFCQARTLSQANGAPQGSPPLEDTFSTILFASSPSLMSSASGNMWRTKASGVYLSRPQG